MKTKELKKKLLLNKETIANLNEKDLNSLKGGVLPTYRPDCYSERCLENPRSLPPSLCGCNNG